MVNLILAFDEEDEIMGTFNRGCLEDFEIFFKETHPVKPKYIKSRTLNVVNIELSLNGIDGPFIFSAYSHGSQDKLVSKKQAYIDESNSALFKNSLFYTVSCSSANKLGDKLIADGCLCYFGYKSLFNYWDGYKEFSECANYGLFKIFEGFPSNETYGNMIEKYNECIDNLVDKGQNYMQAALLRENRDGLVQKGGVFSIKV